MSEIKNHNHIDDLFFIPNGGGRLSSEIKKINTFYVDIDCGKDKNKKYYDGKTVKKFKKCMMEKIDAFEFRPNTITETLCIILTFIMLLGGMVNTVLAAETIRQT